MKIYILIGLLFSYQVTVTAQERSNNYILALSVDLYMNTSSRISCDNFATIFEKILTTNFLSKSDSVAMFSAFIRGAKYVKYNRSIDVRCKFICSIDNMRTIIICSDGQQVMINGRFIKRNKKFIALIKSIAHW
jgi:hypothetical protein